MDKWWAYLIGTCILMYMIFSGWALYTIIARPLWVTVPVTQVCQMDGKNCEWKIPTQNLGVGGIK